MTEYRLLSEFKKLFDGAKYKHRSSNLGDFVAMHLYEDLAAIKTSDKFLASVSAKSRVLNSSNKRTGVQARRGDGSFGELIIGEQPLLDRGFVVGRGPVATIEIGIEVKILMKAMIKQIDRVKNDLVNQAREFNHKSGSSQPICVAIVGINYADVTTGYEGDRSYRTDGKKNKHPIQEAEEARLRLRAVETSYDEFVVLRFKASNEPPYSFDWVDSRQTTLEYGAALMRISREYQRRF